MVMASILSLSLTSLSLPNSQSLVRYFFISFSNSNSFLFPLPHSPTIALSSRTPRKSPILLLLGEATAGVKVVLLHHPSNEERCFSLPSPLLPEPCAARQFAKSLWPLNLSIKYHGYEDLQCDPEFVNTVPALRGKDYGKTKMRYPDYTETESGLQYKDLRPGNGPKPKTGETVVVDWDGYTIGYYGRIFEARNKTKGGSFVGDDKDFFRFKVGYNEVIPAFEEAVSGMALGGIRRIIVPPELGYPDNDFNKGAPRPTTFSGQRALAFVLRNQGLIDKTLLFDIELLKIIPN
ncbi:hypothetical protein V8G54_018497 [Vigna mungo]|uniref:peptidylprolyl isomerase n=1 Tax=Vigna mungo TaxID=3915 RepID=A0AAQ3NAA2_VIGMU